ncbi:unnamed protein product [Mycena citricolor]|uniref:RRM domain-containing protein n=1 Tax=Mycena citricolor TaxID=2018698 RepID=A0AAD2H3N2_9AGAR|nr:unnamed protein product [Mycena citricolor]
MPPKRAKKIPLNEFLGDSALGSWADEMESLPSAPAVRTDEENARGNDRYGRRDDFLSSRPDRVAAGPPRDDLPLPTQPPYTAFVGNLSFDLTEGELEEFFGSPRTKSIKLIKDREDKPKGFGYIEFEDLDDLKDAIAKNGSNFSGRTIRVSVADPPKERGGFPEDDAKFENNWRREGPLPTSNNSREPSRRRFDSTTSNLPSVSEGAIDWRANRPVRSVAPPEPESSYRRRPSNFTPPEPTAADREESWTMGSKFKPAPVAEESSGGSRFGAPRSGPPREPSVKDIAMGDDWRTSRPKAVSSTSRRCFAAAFIPGADVSPANSSTPPTPQLSRRKLELLPRSGSASNVPSPLSSPKIGPTPPASATSRSNPFGAARPVDSANREKEVEERIEKDREVSKEKLSMSRTNSRTAMERTPFNRTRSPPPESPQSPQSPKLTPVGSSKPAISTAPSVRPSLSFASAAKKDNVTETKKEESDASVTQITEVISEVTI